MLRSKKGMSPLVATVLLVAFSVALGALVMSWGQEYIEEKAEFVQGLQEVKSGCSLVELDVIKIGGVPQICKKENNIIEVWFDNGPNIEITNINAKVLGSEGVSVQDEILEKPLMRENAVKTEFMFENVGELRQVSFVPKVFLVDKDYFCSGQTITIDYIPDC